MQLKEKVRFMAEIKMSYIFIENKSMNQKKCKHLDEDCVLPMNVFRQMIEKLQNQEQNS